MIAASNANNSPKATLLVFSDDWGRHPSSCQHLVRRMLDRYHVIWVNTIGTRTPKFDLATLSRAAGKVREWVRPSQSGKPAVGSQSAREVQSGGESQPIVTSPRMWPWFTKSFDRRINKFALTRQLVGVLADAPQPVIALTTLPITADLVGSLPVAKWVYYCVDDFSEWPGLDGSTLKRLDEVMLSRAGTIVAVSDRLREIAKDSGRESRLLTHGVDLRLWRSRSKPNVLHQFAGPRAVFWGVVDRRLDTPSIMRLRERLPGGSVIFFGPQQDPDPQLLSLDGCHFPGPVPFEQLPDIAASADVLIMPYGDMPVTRAMQPLKLKEYLATGRPTVVNRLPSVESLAQMMDVADTPDEFADMVLSRIDSGTPGEQITARCGLESESWDAKARSLEAWMMEGVKAVQ